MYLKIVLSILIVVLNTMHSKSQTKKKNIYLIPGQGADERSFKNLELDSSIFNLHYVKWIVPERKEDMKSYAKKLLQQIDTTKDYYLIGVSLGGMVSTEIMQISNPEKVIIISSAKCRNELPLRYRFQKIIPLYLLIPKRLLKWSSYIAQPLFEPDRKNEKETCVAMLKAKNPTFLKRTIGMIIKWNKTQADSSIIHIHGNKDHTIPVRNVKYNHLINKGSHMMILTRTKEIQEIILQHIK